MIKYFKKYLINLAVVLHFKAMLFGEFKEGENILYFIENPKVAIFDKNSGNTPEDQSELALKNRFHKLHILTIYCTSGHCTLLRLIFLLNWTNVRK